MFGVVLVCEIKLDAIPEIAINPLIQAVTGKDQSEIDAAIQAIEDREKQWNIDRERQRAEHAERQASFDSKMAEFSKPIAGFPEFTKAIGSRGIKATVASTKDGKRGLAFKIIRIDGKGSFGRYKCSYRFVVNLDAAKEQAPDKYKPFKKELKTTDFEMSGYKQLS